MSLFIEDPWGLFFCGLGLELLLGLVLWFTGRAALLRVMIAVLLLTVLAIAIERLVVSNREQIEQLVSRCEQAALAGDTAGLLAEIDPTAAEPRRLVLQNAARVKFEELRITHQEIKVDGNTAPPTATVRLVVRFQARQGGGSPQPGLVAVVVRLHKIDAWKITQANVDPRGLKQ